MSCEPHRPLLSAFRDGELSTSDRDAVAAHVEGCPECTAELSDLEGVANLLRDQVPVPSDERWAEFDAELRVGLQGIRPELHAPRWQRAVFTAAALAAGLLIAVYVASHAAEPNVSLAVSLPVFPSLQHEDPRFGRPPTAPLPPLSEWQDTDLIGTIFSQTQIAAIASHGLVQVRTTATLAELYPLRTPRGLPRPIITPDAALLLHGAVMDRGALALEREVIIPGTQELLLLLARELRVFEITGRTSEVRDAARLARERIGVAVLLHGIQDPLLPPDSLERVQAEVKRIEDAATIEESPILGRKLDYLAFTPRGTYWNDELMRRQFRSARWLSLTGLSMDGSKPIETRAACLIVMALARGELPNNGGYGLAGQARLEAAIEVLFGEPDELTPFDVLRCMKQALPSPAPKLSVLAKRDVLRAIIARARVESEARSTLQINDAEGRRTSQVYLLGNTRSVEARVYTRLTAPLLHTRDEPTSLDLLHLLGSRKFLRFILSVERKDSSGYDDAVATLEPEARAWRDASRPMPFRSSLERGRLLAISALIDGRTAEGPLPFMGSLRYRNRLLLASLSGLNSPQAGPEPSWEDPELSEAAPLVEPLPRFHARLASSAGRLAGVLELLGPNGLRIASAVRDLRRIQRMENALRDASLDVLEGRPPQAHTAQVLREFSSTLRQLGPKDIRSAEDIFELKRLDGSTSILHRCVTRLDRLYVVTLDPLTKKPHLACGAALAGGEKWVPNVRLTPDTLGNLKIPDPLWAKHIE